MTPGWSRGPVMEAESFSDRFRGLRKLEPGATLLIRTSSVHAFGFRHPFRAIGLSAELEVVAHTVVRPWRLARFPGCAFVIEMPTDAVPPPLGSHLEVTDV